MLIFLFAMSKAVPLTAIGEGEEEEHQVLPKWINTKKVALVLIVLMSLLILTVIALNIAIVSGANLSM